MVTSLILECRPSRKAPADQQDCPFQPPSSSRVVLPVCSPAERNTAHLEEEEPDSVRGFVELPPEPIAAERDLHKEGYDEACRGEDRAAEGRGEVELDGGPYV